MLIIQSNVRIYYSDNLLFRYIVRIFLWFALGILIIFILDIIEDQFPTLHLDVLIVLK